MKNRYDLIIVGGGAAGIFAAINCNLFNPNIKIAILEKTSQLLSKVKISGGGRCNVTNACFNPKELVKYYPRGSKELLGAFSQFQPLNTIDWFKNHGVELKTESDNRMFPVSDKSQTIIDCFMGLLNHSNIDILYNIKINKFEKIENVFHLSSQQESFLSKKILITTGGFSNPEHYSWISELGIQITPPIPSLFTLNISEPKLNELQGISLFAKVKITETKFEESAQLLITHWGLSGPAILKLSAFAAQFLHAKNYNFEILVNWLNDCNDVSLNSYFQIQKENFGSHKINLQNEFQLPRKLLIYLLNKAGINEQLKWAEVSKKQLITLTEILLRDRYKSTGKTTFKSEFVTCGGVSLNEVNFKTMESKKVSKLYFAGEVMDIDAVTGGFNFQAAWTTAWIASKAIASEE